MALVSCTAGAPGPGNALTRLFWGFGLLPSRRQSFVGSLPARFPGEAASPEQLRGTPRPAHAVLPLQGAKFGQGRSMGAAGAPLPRSFTSCWHSIHSSGTHLLLTAPEQRGQRVLGPPPVIFQGRQEGFATWPMLGRRWSASCLEKTPPRTENASYGPNRAPQERLQPRTACLRLSLPAPGINRDRQSLARFG